MFFHNYNILRFNLTILLKTTKFALSEIKFKDLYNYLFSSFFSLRLEWGEYLSKTQKT